MLEASYWRQSTDNGIPFRAIKRSGTFSYEDATATEEYIIQASDLADFALYGFPEPTSGLGTVYYPPQPHMPGTSLVPKSIKWESFDDSKPCDPFNSDPTAEEGTYCEYIKVTVDYGPWPGNDQQKDPNDPFTFLEISANASGVFLNSPVFGGNADWVVPAGSGRYVTTVGTGGAMITWVDESEDVLEANVPNTVTETQVEWSVRWPQIPFTFWNTTLMTRLREKLGKVNSVAMPLFLNAPAETILFLGYSVSTNYTWRSGKAGQAPITLDLKFLEKNFTWGESTKEVSVTHQHMWRPDWGWRKLKINDQYLFQTVNLNDLWGTS